MSLNVFSIKRVLKEQSNMIIGNDQNYLALTFKIERIDKKC